MLPDHSSERRFAKLESENDELRALLQKAMEQIAALTQRVENLDDRNAELLARNTELLARNTELEAENTELRSRFSKNSRNSSRPPSSDPPWEKLRKSRGKSKSPKRKRGGQPGHRGHHRALLSPDQVDLVLEHQPHQLLRREPTVRLSAVPLQVPCPSG